MNKITGLFLFVAGAVIGSLVTNNYIKNKYEQQYQEDVAAVREALLNEKKEALKVEKETAISSVNDPKISIIKPDLNDLANKYVDILHKQNYTGYSKKDEIPLPEPVNEDILEFDGPETIPPDEFGEFDDYQKISLTYYSDEVLCDEDDEPVEDIDGIIGEESLDGFGEWDDEIVYVRNDQLKSYFEISMDNRTYADVLKTKPPTKKPAREKKPHEVD
ncbi:MAG: hypothetical protein GX660_25625 [Clostridiaceae bacterium]|nr:hypothetical protein [Clostridiaceae bacterium]